MTKSLLRMQMTLMMKSVIMLQIKHWTKPNLISVLIHQEEVWAKSKVLILEAAKCQAARVLAMQMMISRIHLTMMVMKMVLT